MRIRGFAGGSAERSADPAAALRRDQHRRRSSARGRRTPRPVVVEVGGRRSGTGCRRPAARAGAHEGDRPRRRSRSAGRCGAAPTRAAAWACRRRRAMPPLGDVPDAASRYGWSWRLLADARAARARASTPSARSSSAGPMPESIRSCGEPNAPAARITSRSARADVLAPRARRLADAGRAAALELEAERLRAA